MSGLLYMLTLGLVLGLGAIVLEPIRTIALPPPRGKLPPAYGWGLVKFGDGFRVWGQQDNCPGKTLTVG